MVMRRQLLLGAVACGAAPALTGCSSAADEGAAARLLRQPFAAPAAAGASMSDELKRELVRYATLAPSSHNTQCWKFRIQERSISIEPDLARRCPVVDPDDHHLYVSLGCATENLAQAALANGLQANARFDASGAGSIAVDLQATQARQSLLYQAIPVRQCTRGDYDGSPLSVEELSLLEHAGSGDGVRVILLTEPRGMERVLEYVVAGNTAQLGDPAFVAELKAWIRFSADEAIRTGDGLWSGASGNPSLPRWLGSRLMGWVLTPKSENDRYARQLRNSAGIAVFVSAASDQAHWVEAGRCYERFALQATALGVRNAFLNQAVEVAAVRPQFAAMLGLGSERPDLVVRFGRGPTLPLSMRRPVRAALA
jgi:hypothetical protein